MYFIVIVLFIVAIIILRLHFRKCSIERKLAALNMIEKAFMLNEILAPLGFRYDLKQDILSVSLLYPHKVLSWCSSDNPLACHSDSILDILPVYFDYAGKTWLIEFRKGQYSISSGAEIVIYNANMPLTPEEYEAATFKPVNTQEMLTMRLDLYHRTQHIAHREERHFRLALFDIGSLALPDELYMHIAIEFPNYDMRNAFIQGLIRQGYVPDKVNKSNRVYMHFNVCKPSTNDYVSASNTSNIYVYLRNRLLVRLFRRITKPYHNAANQLLYVYYYCPAVFRRVLRALEL